MSTNAVSQEGMPRLGCSVYYDTLTGNGRHFIDTRLDSEAVQSSNLLLADKLTSRCRGHQRRMRLPLR